MKKLTEVNINPLMQWSGPENYPNLHQLQNNDFGILLMTLRVTLAVHSDIINIKSVVKWLSIFIEQGSWAYQTSSRAAPWCVGGESLSVHYLCHLCLAVKWKCGVIHKLGNIFTLSSEDNRAMTMVNMHRKMKFVKFGLQERRKTITWCRHGFAVLQ